MRFNRVNWRCRSRRRRGVRMGIAERMVKDHSDAGDEADGIVRMKSMMVNDVPSDDQKQMMRSWTAQAGMRLIRNI